MKEEKNKVSEDIEKSLLHILEDIEKEDEGLRARLIREARQHELYWHGFQHIFWDEGISDYRIPTHEVLEEISTREETKFVYEYVVNVFKAHGLSIIAALSAEIPAVPFSPMDADEPKDINAAQKAQELGKVIQKYNKGKLIFYHALFTLYIGSYVCSYNYYERDEEYGTVEIPKYKKGKEKAPDSWKCTNLECNFVSEELLVNCPDCSSDLEHQEGKEEETLVEDGFEEINKGMENITILGPQDVKVPLNAVDQKACGYLIRYCDLHFALVRNMYKNVPRDEISGKGTDSYERQNRIPVNSPDSYNLVTVKKVWLRPWMYDSLPKEEAEALHKKYPKGVQFDAIDSGKNIFARAVEEKMDDHWTITKGDLSRSIYGDPLGKPEIPLQDLENMTVNLLTESLEHSIPSTFADTEILDFEQYSKQEVMPGAIYPTKNSLTPNRRMEDYFFNLKTSTLPKEGIDFNRMVESKGQFVIGAFPSIFGGPQTQGSKTLGEYQESRNYALQRLSIPYQLLFFWWADTIYRSVKDYIKNMVFDEKHVQKTNDGKFVNITILMDDFSSGRFNMLLPESATDLPISFSQKRSTIQQMIQLNNDYLNQFLFSPENRRITLRFLGIEELNDLDSNQTMKQLIEIDELLSGTPAQDEMGMEISSVPIEPEIDDGEIHLRVLRTFLSSPIGQEHKKNNPDGYANALLHAKEHQMLLQQSMIEQESQEQEVPEEEITQ